MTNKHKYNCNTYNLIKVQCSYITEITDIVPDMLSKSTIQFELAEQDD